MTVKEAVHKNPKSQLGLAFQLSKKVHSGQKRKSGEPFFEHPLAVAQTLQEWNLDEASVIAGLLHDSVEDTSLTREEIVREFGEEIAFLVDGVTKLGHIKYRGVNPKSHEEANAQVENLRKMIFALSEDLRVIFVKLADRLHNMRTLSALPPAKQKRIALETNEVYAPIAYRLGMQNLSGELHDLAFPYLHPQEYEWIKKSTAGEYEIRLAYLKKIKPVVEAELLRHNIKPLSIDFRAKRYSSLYKKLMTHEMDLAKIYDLVAFRIIVSSLEECYAVLGILHALWPPLPGRIKDYIAMPKPNGYRSLHTTVFALEGKNVEFQVRTKAMHEEDENGIAAHWLYEQKKSGGSVVMTGEKLKHELQWVEQLRNWQNSENIKTDPKQFLEAMKVDFFKDRIFVISPLGDAFDLPASSTPVDFAYHIHTEIGNTAVAAKVNNQFVPLDYTLGSGDIVEIITQKNKLPSEDWLKFVKTSVARDHIRAALRKKPDSLKRGVGRTEIRLVVKKRLGVLKDITAIIAKSHFIISGVNTADQTRTDFLIVRIQCETTDREKVERLLIKIKKLKEVKEVSYRLV